MEGKAKLGWLCLDLFAGVQYIDRPPTPSSFVLPTLIPPPTMATPQFRQDLPPAGGFETVKYKRNLPLRGPGALVILGGVTAICAFGFYRVGLGNVERRSAGTGAGHRKTFRGSGRIRHLFLRVSSDRPQLTRNSTSRELRREQMWARIHLVPLLMAEGDREAYAASQRAAAVEADIMKNVKNWGPDSSYHNPRYRSM
ncbi:hypothetical protein MIND_00761100 [Mycena indigotica]|uniref:NADH dehydrogenase [ubiquinone] 1 alpha subcomplex subunit 13 n=1 Tax=Mycena indigotica TaxID=2126181 RepID=A0A8H6SN73_9AGAR|nr:uncharacterized protein MIND_00761100 [Mycena indigotica]KAF7301950.1 hypothetical protein MIND_00761100 [Mycena indigotica]